jgi:hypothetical protein
MKCRSQANTYLPAYTNPSSVPLSGSDPAECPCICQRQERNQPAVFMPNSTAPTQPSPLHTHRPMHLIRQPSINPPSFYDDVAPPPLLSPPPNYDDLTPCVEERESYFDNESESVGDVDDESEEVEEIDVTTTSENEVVPIEEEQDAEDDTSIMEEEDIVDMVGLEDLSLNVANQGHRRSADGIGIWV